MITKPYDTKSIKINRESFDEWELFGYVEQLLHSAEIDTDDFKGDINYDEDEDLKAVWVHCNFSWILYYADAPISEFTNLAKKIENLITDAFNINDTEVIIDRYNGNSLYTEDGYDVNLEFDLCYDMG